jgi:predicted RNase H-like nuclease
MRVTGIDGCRTGWVAVDLDGGRPGGGRPAGAGLAAGRLAGVRLGPSLDALLAGSGQVVGIDMALGLLDSGWRAADREARALLGARRSSVFAIPPAPVWEELTYRAANQRCRALTGNGLSAQAWGLRQKLIEANACRRRHPLYEVHPELSFRSMAGTPLRYAKHGPDGAAERRELLAAAGIIVPADAAPARVAADVLDAAAAAWTAQRIAAGQARALPDPPQTDADGYEIAIRY